MKKATSTTPPATLQNQSAPPLPLLPPILSFAPSDAGNAERLIHLFSTHIRFCVDQEKWYIWDGRRWNEDKKKEIREFAIRAVRTAHSTALSLPESDPRKERWLKFLHKSESLHAILAAVSLASSKPSIVITTADLDTHPFLLNMENGIVDLREAKLLPHDPKYLLTKMVRFPYTPTEGCPVFLQFLRDLFQGKGEVSPEVAARTEEMIAYVQRAFGYSLTGNTSNKVIFVLHGVQNCGKSTLLTLFHYLLDPDYSCTISINSLLSASAHSNSARADLADLRGTRFAMTSETPRGCRLAEEQVKYLTKGMGTIKTDRKGENQIEFQESHHLWIDSNHRPDTDSEDNAIWIRLHSIPCLFSIPESQIDPDLLHKMKREAVGALAWGIDGAKSWYNEGMRLQRPPEFIAAQEEWRSETDTLGQFVAECCVLGDPEQFIVKTAFSAAFRDWCAAMGYHESSVTPQFLKARLLQLGVKDSTARLEEGHPTHVWRGIHLLPRNGF